MATINQHHAGIDAEQQIWHYCRHHGLPWFPRLGSRSSFVRQAANLWCIKQLLQAKLAGS